MTEWAQIGVHVLTSTRKTATTPKMLELLDVPHQVYVNPDWELPASHPERVTDRSNRPGVREYAIRQYRAYRGHQEILRRSNTPFTLVFEDDASLDPRFPKELIRRHLLAAPRFLSAANFSYQAVSFHVRKPFGFCRHVVRYGQLYAELLTDTQTGSGHQNFLRPVQTGYGGRYNGFRFKWHEGCLAYMVSAAGRQRWLDADHGHGMPCDLFLANELNTIVLCDSFFLHDATYGSVISGNSRKGDR